MEEKSKRDLDTIISEEHLKPTETYQFIDDSFEQGEITTTGVGITRILPPMPVIGAKGKREAKKQTTPSPQIKPPSSPSTASSRTTTAPPSWLLMMEGKNNLQATKTLNYY